MEEALLAFLLARPGLAALVADRITWAKRAQGSDPAAIVLHRVTSGRTYTNDGQDRCLDPLVQADCLGRSYGEAKAIARALVAALRELADPPFVTAFVEGERDDWFGEDPDPTHRTSLDIRVWHHEP